MRLYAEGAGIDYILVEADKICSGVTKNTTAKITSQHGLIYDKLIRKFGVKRRGFICAQTRRRYSATESFVRISTAISKKEDNIVYSTGSHNENRQRNRGAQGIGLPGRKARQP